MDAFFFLLIWNFGDAQIVGYRGYYRAKSFWIIKKEQVIFFFFYSFTRTNFAQLWQNPNYGPVYDLKLPHYTQNLKFGCKLTGNLWVHPLPTNGIFFLNCTTDRNYCAASLLRTILLLYCDYNTITCPKWYCLCAYVALPQFLSQYMKYIGIYTRVITVRKILLFVRRFSVH